MKNKFNVIVIVFIILILALIYLFLRKQNTYDIILNGNAYNGELLKDGDHVQFMSFSFFYFK